MLPFPHPKFVRQSATPDNPLKYRPDIDGLRAVAVIAVILFHVFPGKIRGGFVGVDVFFVISGYLISQILLRDLQVNRFNLLEFYARRARRIFPALAIVLVATMAAGWWISYPDEFVSLGRHVMAGALFSSNLLLWNEAGYFDVEAIRKPLLHLWSLGVEEQFYLMWPLLLSMVWRHNRRPYTAVLVIAGASFALGLWLVRVDQNSAFYLPFSRFWELMLGVLLAVGSIDGDPLRSLTRALGTPARDALVRDLLAAGGVMAILVATLLFDQEGHFPGMLALAPTLGAAAIIAAGPATFVNRRILSSRLAVYIGLISYPLYLWHWPGLSFIDIVTPVNGAWIRPLKFGVVVFAVLAAMATYHFVERPLRARRDPVRLMLPTFSALLVSAMLGFVLVSTGGFRSRTTLASDPFAWPVAVTAGCSVRYDQPAATVGRSYCIESSPGRTPTVIVTGDSHANALAQGILSDSTMLGTGAVLMIGAPGCPPFRHTTFWRVDEPQRKRVCPGVVEATYRAIGRTRPRMIIATARLSAYVPVREFDTHAASTLGGFFASLDFPDQRPAEFFAEVLERDLRTMLEDDRDVVFMLTPPELDFDPHRCLRARPIERYYHADIVCESDRAHMLRHQAAFRPIVQQVVEKIASPKLRVIDPFDVLCDATTCHAVIGGEVLYRDTNHLNAAGARFVLARLMAMGRGQ